MCFSLIMIVSEQHCKCIVVGHKKIENSTFNRTNRFFLNKKNIDYVILLLIFYYNYTFHRFFSRF